MDKNSSNRRDFIKQTTLTTAAVGLFGPVTALSQTSSAANTIAAAAADLENFSIQNVASSQSSSVDFNGDDINRPHDILWNVDQYVKKKGGWPKPQQKTKVVVVGGGISGLLSAYFLKNEIPLVLEQSPVLGGNSKGEIYNKSMYSIGAAYITVPDANSPIEKLLNELNIYNKAKHESEDEVQCHYKNQFTKGFWQCATDPARAAEFIAVAAELKRIFEQQYPAIPWSADGTISLDLWKRWDQTNFKDWLLARWPNLHPHILEFFQLYCWSSMNGSMEELSALQVLNFITAETVGVLAFPAGNSLLTYQLHKDLLQNNCTIESGAFVLRVQKNENSVIVTYENLVKELKAVECDYCVIAAPKFVVAKIVPQLPAEQLQIMEKISYRGYIVANVILNKKIPSVGYDVFSLTGEYPEPPGPLNPSKKGFSDVCFGSWAQNDQVDESILTLYKPLPYDGARQFLFNPAAHDKSKKQIMDDLEVFLKSLGLTLADIKGIRLSRWGHSLPLARPNLLASGNLETMCRPVECQIFFANQDNYANPAFESAFAAAEKAANEIKKKIQ